MVNNVFAQIIKLQMEQVAIALHHLLLSMVHVNVLLLTLKVEQTASVQQEQPSITVFAIHAPCHIVVYANKMEYARIV